MLSWHCRDVKSHRDTTDTAAYYSILFSEKASHTYVSLAGTHIHTLKNAYTAFELTSLRKCEGSSKFNKGQSNTSVILVYFLNSKIWRLFGVLIRTTHSSHYN